MAVITQGGRGLINIQVNWASLLSAFELLSLLQAGPVPAPVPGPVPAPLPRKLATKDAQDMVMVNSSTQFQCMQRTLT